MSFELVGVPYTSMAKPGGIARAIEVLRDVGLAEALADAGVTDAGDLSLLVGDGERGPSGLLNEAALGRLVAATRAAVMAGLGRGRAPLLVGGDCPVLLGALAAVGERDGASGLLHVDGHEDGWPPSLSPTGEASDSEVAIALGRVDPLPHPLDPITPLVDVGTIAMLGPRDRAEIAAAGAHSLAGEVALFRDDEGVRERGPARAAREAVAALAEATPAFWLHIDLDALSTAEFPAADYLQDGGLAWDELFEIASVALAAPACCGASVVIYNPGLDPERTSARRIVRFLSELTAGTR